MKKTLIVSLLSFAVAFPALAVTNIGSSGQDGVSVDLGKVQAQAAICVQQCGLKTNVLDAQACVLDCAKAAGVTIPRDTASGLPTGKVAASLCVAACKVNLQGKPVELEMCTKACGSIDADTARLLPTVNKIVDEATGKVKSTYDVKANVKARCAAACKEDGSATPDMCTAECVAAVEAGITAPRDSASGQATGKRQYAPAIFRKELGKASPLLAKAIAGKQEMMKDAMTHLKEHLAMFKDQKKASTTEYIADALNKLNERLTAHFGEQLDKMNDIMDRVQTADVDGDGTADIALADAAMLTAQAAVTAQAGKSYTVDITDETKVKADVQAVRKQLHDDLAAVEKLMQAARQAVRKAATHVDKPAVSANADASSQTETNTQ